MAIFNLSYLRSLISEADQKRRELSLSEPDETGAQITFLPFKLKFYWPGCIGSPYYQWKAHIYQLKESAKLRKGTQHYHRIVRRDGKVIRIDRFVHHQLAGVLLMHYEGNKRYAFSYPSSPSTAGNQTEVVVFHDGHIAEDYMIHGSQIVYRKYTHIAGETYTYHDINYIPTSQLPLNWIRIGTITTGENSTRMLDLCWPTSVSYDENGKGHQYPALESGIVEA